MQAKKLFLFLSLTLSLQAFSAEDCNALFERQRPVGNYLRKNVSIPVEGKNGPANKLLIQEAVKKITGKEFTATTFDTAVDKVYKHLLQDTSLTGVQKAQKMTGFAKTLNPVFEDMISKVPVIGSQTAPDLVAWGKRKAVIDKVKTVKFDISRKVSKFEEFSYDEFKVVAKDDIVLSRGTNLEQLTHMKMKDYPKYIDSYIRGLTDSSHPSAALYNNIDEGSLGILSISDIRDITSYNVWPMYAKWHDIRHIHYSLSHPMALAAMMGTTRSKNNLRYVLQGGLYEGVDRVQYGHETALNTFFSAQIQADEVFGIKRSLDLEEAMLTVANATDEELNHLARVSGGVDGFVSDIANWVPKRVEGGKLTGHALDGEPLEQEIDNMVAQYTALLKKSEKIHQQLLADPDMVLSKEEEHFMKIMNFQLNPESPEIVIEGLRYKNDGRAHAYGNGYDISIGIGNQ